MNSISQNIKAYRKNNNLTQQQLADHLGVTHQTVSNWESGRSMPNIDTLTHIADKMDTDINYLLYGKKADNEQLKKQIAINAILYAIVHILWQAVRLYQRYREANGVNKFIQATTDLWYYLPARVFFCFFTPLMHILPAVIFCQWLKYKGYVKNITGEKAFSRFKYFFIFVLVNRLIASFAVLSFTDISAPGFIYSYLPPVLKKFYTWLYMTSAAHPWMFSVMGAVYEMLRPFKNEKATIPDYSPGRNNSIARNIRKLRTEKGLTQKQLADKLFVTRQTVSNWENGKIMPDVNMLISIADNTEADLDSLLYSETVIDKKTVFDFICTVTVITLILALIIARRIIWHTLPSHFPTWWQQAFMLLYNSVRGVLIRPVLFFTIPVLTIQIFKLMGRFASFKGLRYRKILAFLIILFMMLTFYNYLPYMIKTDLKRCFQLSQPILWMNYPSFDWLVSLPRWLSRPLYYICDNMRWVYSLLGILFEISKPYGTTDKNK